MLAGKQASHCFGRSMYEWLSAPAQQPVNALMMEASDVYSLYICMTDIIGLYLSTYLP